MGVNSQNSSNSSNYQEQIIDNVVSQLDENVSEEVKNVLENPKNKEEIVNISYQNLLKENSILNEQLEKTANKIIEKAINKEGKFLNNLSKDFNDYVNIEIESEFTGLEASLKTIFSPIELPLMLGKSILKTIKGKYYKTLLKTGKLKIEDYNKFEGVINEIISSKSIELGLKPNPKELKEELTQKIIGNINEESKSSENLENFIENSQNNFFLSQKKLQSLSDEELNKKLFEIGIFLDKYENVNLEERKQIRQQHPLPKISDFPQNIQEIIKSKISDKNSFFESQGAENINQGKINSDVYKLTKGRHNDDYFSILQLQKFMIALEKDFRDENKKLENFGSKAKIKNANEELMFYEDENGNYKRLIKQGFAPGESVDVALKKELHNAQWKYLKKDPRNNCVGPDSKCKYKKLINLDNKLDDILLVDFNTYLEETKSPLFKAYKDFLQSIQNISDEKGYLLDITDSRQGGATKRGNILNTSNVFVKEKNGIFTFTVIDPDVFNKDGKNKFEGKEQERAILEKLEKQLEKIDTSTIKGKLEYYKTKALGILEAKKTNLVTEITNFARDGIQRPENKFEEKISKIAVAPKQEMYMDKILKQREYNLEVDEKLKNDLIFWTNISRLAFRRYKKIDGRIVPLSDDEIVDNQKKYNDSIKNLESIGKKVKILDFYPKNKQEEESGFGGIFVEIDGEKYFIPKGTKKEKKHKNDKIGKYIGYKPKDIKADIDLMFQNIPTEQVKSMIDFFESLDLKENEKINILGNSLGGALGQIMMKMYPDKFKKGIFPHSPGASDLKINLSLKNFLKLDKKYKKRFENYIKTKKVDADLIYIDGENPFRPISGLGKKLESKNNTKQFTVTGWKLHFMPQLIKYMKNLRIGSIVKVKEY